MKEVALLGVDGCSTCSKIGTLIDKVISDNGFDVRVEKIYDMGKILEYGVVSMPGLVVDGELKICGRIPTEDELKELLA